MIINEIIPQLLKFGIIEEVVTNQTHQANTKAWRLKQYTVQEIYKAEEDNKSDLYGYWEEVNNHE